MRTTTTLPITGTRPVTATVQHAIEQWAWDNERELDKALALFGLKASDIILPHFEQATR